MKRSEQRCFTTASLGGLFCLLGVYKVDTIRAEGSRCRFSSTRKCGNWPLASTAGAAGLAQHAVSPACWAAPRPPREQRGNGRKVGRGFRGRSPIFRNLCRETAVMLKRLVAAVQRKFKTVSKR